MEDQHNLKYHGNYSLFEQNNMTGEERKWILERIQKQIKDEREAGESASRRR
jgi:hypothetical protein